MTPAKHHTNNAVLAAPTGEQPGANITPLPITQLREYGIVRSTSFWYPSPEEMRAIAEGHPVTVSVFGHHFPPMYVGVTEE